MRLGREEVVFSSSGEPIRVAETNGIVMAGRIFASLVSVFGASAESLFATFSPSHCRWCGIPLTNIPRLPVCRQCQSQIRPIAGGLCEICGERLTSLPVLSSQYGDPRCGLCRRVEPPFAKAVAYGSYHGLRELIHLLKHDRVRSAANVLGPMLADAIAKIEPALGSSLLLIPVPLRLFTTGMTLWECARVLRPARAAKVWVATVARTMKQDAHLGRRAHLAPIMAAAG
jgi:predicted amidophosphoribosyltransferase